jgi:hypothetical protein
MACSASPRAQKTGIGLCPRSSQTENPPRSASPPSRRCRQRCDLPQHLPKYSPCQVTLRQQQPLVRHGSPIGHRFSGAAAASWLAASCRLPWAVPAATIGCRGYGRARSAHSRTSLARKRWQLSRRYRRRLLAFFDPLLRGRALVLEAYHSPV